MQVLHKGPNQEFFKAYEDQKVTRALSFQQKILKGKAVMFLCLFSQASSLLSFIHYSLSKIEF